MDYSPLLNSDGEAAQFVLTRCTGSTPMSEIANGVVERWSSKYRTQEEASRFVQSIVKHFA